jgi:hypothetical protein
MSIGKISCIMVTRPGRLGLAQRAIVNFHAQTYPDTELVIVSPARFNMPDEHAELVVAPNVKWVNVRARDRLARMFKQGFRASTGAWITYWDDDNLWHPRRLERQVYTVEDCVRRTCFLRDNMMAFMDTREIFVCLRRNGNDEYFRSLTPYSLFVRRDHFCGVPEDGSHPIVKSVRSYPIKARAEPIIIPFEWKMGVIGVRGDNVRSYEAHRDLVGRRRVVMGVDWLLSMREEVICSIDQLQWWEAGTWHICGHDGVAFSHAITNACGEEFDPVGGPDDDVIRESQEV